MNLASKSTADPAKKVVVHRRLFCRQRILLQKDRQGTSIPFDENTLQHHECACVDYWRSQLKKVDFTEHNHHDNSSKGERQLGQSTLLEFIQGDAANNESNHDGGNAIRPTTLTTTRRLL